MCYLCYWQAKKKKKKKKKKDVNPTYSTFNSNHVIDLGRHHIEFTIFENESVSVRLTVYTIAV